MNQLISKEGKANLDRQLIDLNKQLANLNSQTASTVGTDAHDNFASESLSAEIQLLESRINSLKNRLQGLTTFESSPQTSEVKLNSIVIIRFLDTDEEVRLQLVGVLEGSPENNKISYESELGKKLHGSTCGQILTIKSPGGEYEVEVIEIIQ